MLFPIQQLLEGRPEPMCAVKGSRVSDALIRMVANDYSQLPVIDGEGHLSGIISEDSIIRTYYYGDGVPLLDLTVDHCQKPAVTAPPDSDIFEVLDLLKATYAVVIVREQRPVGILTDYDTTHFFRDISEGLILVEDIEVTLRQYIEAVLDTEHAMDAALVSAFGPHRRNPGKPAYAYDSLSFGQHILLIVTGKNWPKFERLLAPKGLFQSLMDNVREIRNQLAHFRGRLDPVQYQALLHARNWLASRPRPRSIAAAEEQRLRVAPAEVAVHQGTGTFERLTAWLRRQEARGRNIRVSFEDIESLLGQPLPPSARQHRSWWANDPSTNRQCLAWMRAGWSVEDVDLAAEEVVFRRTDTVLQQLFFADLLERMKNARPDITRATKTQPCNWWSWAAGKTGFWFVWTLTGSNALRIELSIDPGDKAENKAAFDRLHEQKEAIERDFGGALRWERLDSKKSSRIAISRSHTRITDPPEELEKAKQWAVETTLSFVDTLRPRVQEL